MTDAIAAAVTPGTAATNAANLAAGQTNLNTSYSTFLTLLTTQLKNQDPTAPLDTNQFTQQLVQMTGVQQQLLSNELLQQIANQGSSGGVAGAVDLIGKSAVSSSPTSALSGGQAGWTYTLNSAAAAATLTITDSSTGRAVWTGAAPSAAAGAHAFTWNGKTQDGAQLPDGGAYTLTVGAADASGQTVSSSVSISGVVSGVAQSGSTTLVKIGAASVPLSTVASIGPS